MLLQGRHTRRKTIWEIGQLEAVKSIKYAANRPGIG